MHLRPFSLSILSVLACTSIAACGGSTEDSTGSALPADDGGTSDGTASDGPQADESEASVDAPAEPAVPYPAPHPGMPEIPKGNGPVLVNPKLVTVTWSGDATASFAETFDDWIVGSSWWSVMTEYGVGAGTSPTHVSIADPAPTKILDSEIRVWLHDRIEDDTLPYPEADTLYMLYYPSGTTVTLDQAGAPPADSCSSFGGYHNWGTITLEGGKTKIQYAVIPRCGGKGSITTTASHEIAEACTDPHVGLFDGGYYLFDETPWNPPGLGGEVADMCEFYGSVTEGGYKLARSWSNANAKIGQNPCQPAPADPSNAPYYNAAVVEETLEANPGDTVATQVDCYSFGPLPNPLTLEGQAFAQGILTFQFDPPTCVNGDVVTMSITVDPSAQSGTNYHYFLYANLDQQSSHAWRGMISVL